MMYTIGNGDGYRDGIKKFGKKFLKVGQNDAHRYPHVSKNYPGGYAFLSKEDAERRIAEILKKKGTDYGLEVFGLEAEESDTIQSFHGWWRRLINDALIVEV